jgi:hypothetical protein
LLLKSYGKFVFSSGMPERDTSLLGRSAPPIPTINDNGYVLFQGRATNLRLISFHNTYGEWKYTQHPDPELRHGDTIRVDTKYAGGDDEDLELFLAKTAHEMQHAINAVSSSAPGAKTATFADRAANYFRDESSARGAEKVVLTELRDKRGSRTVRDAKNILELIDIINNDSDARNIVRSYPSGPHTKTYAERFTLDFLRKEELREKRLRQPNTPEWQAIWRDIDAVLDHVEPRDPLSGAGDAAPAIEQISEPLRSARDYGEALAMTGAFADSAIARSPYVGLALLYFFDRILDYRWRKFNERFGKAPEYFIELEKVAKEHAALLLGSIEGATFESLYGEPTQTSPLHIE